MIDQQLRPPLDEQHLCHELTRSLAEVLFPDDRHCARPTEECHEFPLGEKAFLLLVLPAHLVKMLRCHDRLDALGEIPGVPGVIDPGGRFHQIIQDRIGCAQYLGIAILL
jgi:hypothetical protein